MDELTLSQIEGLDDVCDAMELCELHKVQDDGLDSLNEYKERIWCHQWMLKHGNYKQAVIKSITESFEEKKKRLIDILKQIAAASEDLEAGSQFHAHTDTDSDKMEGTSTNLRRDCEERIENIQTEECVILVAGEIAAGRKSVLNLLIGERILPIFWYVSPITITTVRYGERSAKIIYNDANIETDTVILDEEGLAYLRDMSFAKTHKVQEVQLYLPLCFLKTGLVLADIAHVPKTEGPQKNPVKYITENRIFGLIYVIKTDSGGGVDDRIQLVLKMLTDEQKNKRHGLPFDPRATLFVCNKCDGIQEEERLTVQHGTLKSLNQLWPEFELMHAVFFSANRAQRDVDVNPEYINKEYRALLDAIKRLFCMSLDRRIMFSYKWTETLMQRIDHFLKTSPEHTTVPDTESMDTYVPARKKQKLQTKLTQFETIMKEMENLRANLKDY